MCPRPNPVSFRACAGAWIAGVVVGSALPAVAETAWVPGVVGRMECGGTGPWHYDLYVPTSVTGALPAAGLVAFDWNGEAPILSKEAAERHGVVMVGLVEARSADAAATVANRDAVVCDLRDRGLLDPRRLYVAGLSDGAHAAADARGVYPAIKGVIMGCMGRDLSLSAGQCVVWLCGTRDHRFLPEARRSHYRCLMDGMPSSLVLFDDGHTWGDEAARMDAVGRLIAGSGTPVVRLSLEAATPWIPWDDEAVLLRATGSGMERGHVQDMGVFLTDSEGIRWFGSPVGTSPALAATGMLRMAIGPEHWLAEDHEVPVTWREDGSPAIPGAVPAWNGLAPMRIRLCLTVTNGQQKAEALVSEEFVVPVARR